MWVKSSESNKLNSQNLVIKFKESLKDVKALVNSNDESFWKEIDKVVINNSPK